MLIQPILLVLGLMALGAGLMIWPMLQLLWSRDSENRVLRIQVAGLESLVRRLEAQQNVQIRASGRSTVLGTFVLLTSFGCSSASPQGPKPLRPPLPSQVPVALDRWSVPEDPDGEIRLPYRDFRALAANHKRWVDYGKAWEVRGGE
jgi:hypothetical protein